MFRKTHPTKVPCALRGYLTRGAASTDSRRPFDEDCHLAFLEWVSRLKCPNYNCRQKGFKSLESFSNHVSNCVYLLETDYWCSFCCQVEYLGVEECRGRSFIVNDSNRDSKLRRAGQFLKRISCVYYRNPIKKFHRRNLGMVANSTELATNAGYPWWKAELETHEHAVLIPDRSSIEWTPQYPNDPKDFRYSITENPKELYELETSCNGEPSGQNPAAIRSSQTLRSLNGNRRRSEIPTIQEMEASNSRRMSASYLSTPRGRTTSSSHENTKSQRNSRFGLRVSTTSRPLENTPAAYTFEQFPASDPKTSNFSISSSVIPGSSPVEPSGLVSPQCDPHIPIIVGQHPQDHDVISPISTEGVQPCDQIPQNLVSPTTYLASGPNSVQEDRVVQRGHMTPHFSGSDEGPRRLRCEQILGTMIEPTTENSPILTEDIKNRAPPEYAEVPIVYRNQARDEPELEDFAPSLLLEQVINPLLQHSDFEPFHPLILEARHLLSSGHLRNVRDVDVMLVACCRKYCQSQDLTTKYIKEVTSLSNSYMSWPSFNWRDLGRRHYCRQLQDMSTPLKRAQQSVAISLRSAGYTIDAVADPSFINFETPSSATSSFSPSSYNSYASRATFHTPISSTGSTSCSSTNEVYHPWTAKPNATSLVTDTPCTSPSESQGPMEPPSPRTFCPFCKSPFTGVNRNSNLGRHIRTAHRKGPRLLCSAPNCGKSFQRSDYLKQHYKKIHNIER